MRRFLLILTVLAVFTAGCGDDGADLDTTGPADDADAPGGDDAPPDDDADAPGGDDAPPDDDADAPGGDEPVLGAGPYPIADLSFVVRLDGSDGDRIEYRLACIGDTATLTGDATSRSAETMCLALNDLPVGPLLTEPSTDRICTQIYGGPEIATVIGTLDGSTVDTEIGRYDGCGIGDWDVLTSLLPSPA